MKRSPVGSRASLVFPGGLRVSAVRGGVSAVLGRVSAARGPVSAARGRVSAARGRRGLLAESRRGVTLIELLVVLAGMAVLTGLAVKTLVPMLQLHTRYTKEVARQLTVSEIARMWRADVREADRILVYETPAAPAIAPAVGVLGEATDSAAASGADRTPAAGGAAVGKATAGQTTAAATAAGNTEATKKALSESNSAADESGEDKTAGTKSAAEKAEDTTAGDAKAGGRPVGLGRKASVPDGGKQTAQPPVDDEAPAPVSQVLIAFEHSAAGVRIQYEFDPRGGWLLRREIPLQAVGKTASVGGQGGGSAASTGGKAVGGEDNAALKAAEKDELDRHRRRWRIDGEVAVNVRSIDVPGGDLAPARPERHFGAGGPFVVSSLTMGFNRGLGVEGRNAAGMRDKYVVAAVAGHADVQRLAVGEAAAESQ